MKYSFDDLNQRYENYTSFFRCDCVFATEVVGGQPASEEGIRAYVIHHLKIEDLAEQEKAVQRILREEVQSVTPPEGEIPEGVLYGLRVLRKNALGSYLGDWMIKANIKQASSRLYIFQQILGTKGAFAEAGRVRAIECSLQDTQQANLIYLRNADNTGPAQTYFKEFSGRVSTPKGMVSIKYQSECIAPGTRFAFEFHFMPVKGLKEDAIRDLLAMMMIMGLGSNRSLECGKFRILNAQIEMAAAYNNKPPEVPKPPEAPKAEKSPKIKPNGGERHDDLQHDV